MPNNIHNQMPPANAGPVLGRLTQAFGELPQVVAVVLAGSRAAATNDSQSDFDLYVYTLRDVPMEFRRALLGEGAEINNRFWEPGDEWTEPSTGTQLDIMYRSPEWIESQLDRVLVGHESTLGYTTCFWYNVVHSEALFDPRGWYRQLQNRAHVPYPEGLRRSVVMKNWPVLRRNHSSYRRQIELALNRGDAVNVQHRVTALLASFFEVWFALERQPHPGEKRLLSHLQEPWVSRVRALLDAQPTTLITYIDSLLDPLDARLAEEGLLAPTGQIEHAAAWVADLERACAFYERWFKATIGPKYSSTRRPFTEGDAFPPAHVSLEPSETRRLNIKSLVPAEDAHNSIGGISITYAGPPMGIGAQVTISGFHGFGNVDAPVFDDMMYKSNDSDAVWWEPQSARSFLILGNSSQDPVHAQIDFANRFRVDLDLAAHSTVIRSIPHLRADHNGHDGDRDHEGTINSLHVAGTGMPGTLRVTGYTVSDEGFLNTIRGYDPSSSTEAAVYANGLHFSASDNHLLVKNLTINPITVSGTIYPIAASKSVSPLTISEKQITGGAAVELALPKSENAESFDGSSVKLTSSGPAGSIVASYSSHNSNNRITRAVPFKDIGDPGISTGGYPWRIDGHYDSKIYITNVGKIRAAFGGAIRPKGGPEYFIDTHYLEVGETAVLDIRRLRDEQIADPHGIKLSNDATAGQFDWTTIHGDGSQRLIGRNEVTDGSSGVSASFSCGGVCNCPYSITYAFLTPGEPVVFENGASSLTATAQSTPTCSGGYPSNFTIYPYAWSINNPGYFTVSPVNQPTSNFQGTVTPGASWFYTPYTGVQYAWNGQSGQCVTNGNPVLNPGGNGFTQTPSQHTYPNAPLAGCRVRVPFDGVINKTTGKKHQAQDTVSSSIQVGTPVYAPEAGTITNFATGNPHDTRDPSVCGGTGVPANFIELQQDSDGALTRLYHVTILANLATKGTHVNGGVQIGTIDISGCTSAPHTHIQRKVGGVLVNFTMPCDNSHFDDPGTYYDDSEAW